jgi:hypothetical protein
MKVVYPIDKVETCQDAQAVEGQVEPRDPRRGGVIRAGSKVE